MRASSRSKRARRAVHQAREGGEVERQLLDPALAQQLDRADDQELHQAVRRCRARGASGRATSRRGRSRARSAGSRRPRRPASRATTTTLSARWSPRSVSIAIEKPRSGASAAPALRHRLELGELRLARARAARARSAVVARLARAGHGLAHLADRAPLERERGQLDDRLVADVEGLEPGSSRQLRELLAGADHAEREAAHLGEGAQLAQQAGERLARARPGRPRRAARRSRSGSPRTRCAWSR